MVSYLFVSVLIGAVMAAWDNSDPVEYIYIIPLSKFVLFNLAKQSVLQLFRFIIVTGFLNVFIGSIATFFGGEERLPDYELSKPKQIDRKEWMNFPLGTLFSSIRLLTHIRTRVRILREST
jgi:hypothetical protein